MCHLPNSLFSVNMRQNVQTQAVELESNTEVQTLAQDSVATQEFPINSSAFDESNDVLTQQLGRVDGGRDAWQVLIAAFVFEALLWGKTSMS